MLKSILEADSILLEYGNHKVLSNIYLKLETGKITGLIGRNGSGKTSLMNVIFGMQPTTSKSIRINAKTLLKEYRNPEDLQYAPQFHFIPKSLKVQEVFKLFQADQELFHSYFPDLSNCFHQKMGRLSGGTARVVEIFCVLTSPSRFCMLDEPFTHIMPLHLEAFEQLLQKIKQRKGILLSDHLHERVKAISDELLLLENGSLYPF